MLVSDCIDLQQPSPVMIETAGGDEDEQVALDATLPREVYRFSSAEQSVARIVLRDDDQLSCTRRRVLTTGNCDPHSAYDQAYLRTRGTEECAGKAPKVRVIDLFSGCGGLSLGAREACSALGYRFQSALAIDWNSSALEVYSDNFDPLLSCACDVNELMTGDLGDGLTAHEAALVDILGRVDVLLAGPPCQGHSDLNNHTRRTDERNLLYERVGRFAEVVRPRHVLVENVPTIVHSEDQALQTTRAHLAECGYEVDTGVIDLSQLGVPQTRKRHVLVASLERSVSIEAVVERHHVEQVRSVKWAIEDLEDEHVDGIFHQPTRHEPKTLERINYLFEHNVYDLPNYLRPPCHQAGNHSYKSMYGRLRYDEPAQTITGGYGSPGQGRFVHPTRRRALTPHEAARLQFFPDSFDFSSVSLRGDLAEMIGNAVPMKLSYVFCLDVLSNDR